MAKKTELADYFTITGDPFIDSGALVIETLTDRFSGKSLYDHVEFVTDVYIKKWKQKLHSIFHTNSKLLNPSTKGKHKQDTLAYFILLLKGNHEAACIKGYCKTCGNKGLLYSNSRSFYPLTGSGAFLNFHHDHEEGTYLCSKCSIKLYFLPLGVVQLGKYIGLLHTRNKILKKYWQAAVVEENLNKIAKNNSDNILKSKYKNPRNALFYLATDIIEEVCNKEYNDILQLYHFTNYAQSPYCDIYTLPHPVFRYLNRMLNTVTLKKAWYYFINRHYRIKNANWNQEDSVWIKTEKKDSVILKLEDYIDNGNTIFERLLNGQGILSSLLRTYKVHYKNDYNHFPLEITIYYAKEVLGMSEDRIKLIKRVADKIIDIAGKEHNFKKYLYWLESAGKAYQLRGALLKIIRTNYFKGEKEPIFRLDEYVSYLFPDGSYWGEVRDMLLIYIYEKLHDLNIREEEIPENDITETEEPVKEF